MRLYKGGKEIDLTPEQVVKVQEAIKKGQLVVQIGGTFCWVYNLKGVENGQAGQEQEL